MTSAASALSRRLLEQAERTLVQKLAAAYLIQVVDGSQIFNGVATPGSRLKPSP